MKFTSDISETNIVYMFTAQTTLVTTTTTASATTTSTTKIEA